MTKDESIAPTVSTTFNPDPLYADAPSNKTDAAWDALTPRKRVLPHLPRKFPSNKGSRSRFRPREGPSAVWSRAWHPDPNRRRTIWHLYVPPVALPGMSPHSVCFIVAMGAEPLRLCAKGHIRHGYFKSNATSSHVARHSTAGSSNDTKQAAAEYIAHIEHCFDYLRQVSHWSLC